MTDDTNATRDDGTERFEGTDATGAGDSGGRPQDSSADASPTLGSLASAATSSRRGFLGGLAAGSAGLTLGAGGATAQAGSRPREVEALDRGVVAVPTDGGILVRWRLLATDPQDVGFHVYRDGDQVTDDPVTGSTNYVDPDGSPGDSYAVAPVDGEESKSVQAWSDTYLDIPLNRPGEQYHPNDCSVGDLTGNGQYDVVVKWYPDNAQDNAFEGHTDPTIFDAYTLGGEHLWRIDLGHNVRSGAHYAQFLVYDFDGDGISEFVVRTADGTTDGAGDVIGDPDADYVNGEGRTLEGPEYLTVFDGSTGEEIVTTDFEPARGDICDWGDCYGNRGERFLAGVAYLDGETPSIVQCRGYYDRSALAAFDFRDGELTQRWHFDTADGWGEYAGQGNHQLSVADVDGDGYDEIVYGAMVVDHDGTGLHSTGWNHGDALHCGDLVPSRDGLEIFMPHESGPYGATMRDAETGEPLWTVEAEGDVGRGVAGNIDPSSPGAEAWASNGVGLREGGSGEWIADAPGPKNFLVWWTGDLKREFLDDTWIGEWDPGAQSAATVEDFDGVGSNNGTKATPCLSGDILGDWREEVLLRRSDDEALRLFATPYPTEHRLPTFMHDTQYRTAIAWQNVAYNQPPHPSFYVGEDMAGPPEPNVAPVGDYEPPDRLDSGTYRIEAQHSGKALTVGGEYDEDGAPIVQREWANLATQHWEVEHLGRGVYRIDSVHSDRSLDVFERSEEEGAEVVQWEWNDGSNQRFRLTEHDEGYSLEAVHSGYVLEVSEAADADGAPVVQWSWNGGDNQRWSFEPVDGEPDEPGDTGEDCENGIDVDGTQVCDPDGDGLFDDWTGDGELTTADVSEFQANVFSDGVQNNQEAFNFAGGDSVSHGDVIALFQQATGV